MSDHPLHHSVWLRSFGLLPVPLFSSEMDDTRHVLLNGLSGNFCLDEGIFDSVQERCSIAWSANVGHHLTITSDFVEIARWDRPNGSERFSIRSVIERLPRFHRYLEQNSPDYLHSLVMHALGIYRSIRESLGESETGFNALGAFLSAISLASDMSAGHQKRTNWKLPPEAKSAFDSVPSVEREILLERLSTGTGSAYLLRPHLDLLLRHASGALFQEAHAQARLPKQRWLPGLGPIDLLQPRLASEGLDGAFFTPPSIARSMAQEAVRLLPLHSMRQVRIFDPACGSGELLKEVLRILEVRKFNGTVQLTGWDKSAAATHIANFSLHWEAEKSSIKQVDVEVRCLDSIAADHWPTGIDLLIMNPPFKSWQQMGEEERAAVDSCLAHLKFNKPNLAAAFLRRSIESLGNAGALATIAPRSVLDGHSSAALRDFLLTRGAPALIVSMASPSLFVSATVQSGIVVMKIGSRDQLISPTFVWTDPRPSSIGDALRGLRRFQEGGSPPIAEASFSVYRDIAPIANSKSWIPMPYSGWEVSQLLKRTKSVVKASALYKIQQGVRLGSDVFLVDQAFFQSMTVGEKNYFRPAVTNSSIVDGRLAATAYVFYPYSREKRRIASEDALKEAVPLFYENRLLPAKAALSKRKSLKGTTLMWWDLLRSRSWQQEYSAKLVSKYFGSKGAFAWDADGNYVVVVGHGWIPQDAIKGWDFISATDYSQAVVAILTSRFAEGLLSTASVQVGGGQWDLSAKYLGALSLPAPSKLNAPLLRELAELATELQAEGTTRTADLDRLTIAAYGLSNEISAF